METEHKKNIRFDWALKRLLRNKANFKVLEGFLSELLKEDVTVKSISDSEGNQDHSTDKFNRVDVMVENNRKELFLIEIQNSNEADYFLRMLYGVSRAITNHMKLGDHYQKVRKVYSINIVYFEIGHGSDYVYHGKNEFHGIHDHDLLELSVRQKAFFGKEVVSSIYPEYYLIKVNGFDDVARDTLDEWIYYLKNDVILDEFKAKGLPEARELLQIDSLPAKEYAAYIHHVEMQLLEKNAISDSKSEGLAEGIAQGLAEGLAEGIAQGETERKALEANLEREKANLEKEKANLEKERSERKHEKARFEKEKAELEARIAQLLKKE